jgi:xanthine dehydrogenase accessory factor
MVFDALAAAQHLREEGSDGVLATVVWRRSPSSGQVGQRAIVHPDGRIEGWIGGACAEPTVVREALTALEQGASRLVHLGPPDELPDPAPEGTVCVPISCESEGSLQVYLEPIVPPPHLVVVGRTVAVEVLAAMAGALGWRTDVADADLDPSVVSAGSMVVVATQGHHDEEALEAALATDAAYVGLVASRTRAGRVRAYLSDRGFAVADVDRIHAPAGLDLGATAHAEIAVAVLAELVQLRAAGELHHTPAMVAKRDEVMDPVCGMTVAADSRHVVTHAGREYRFCCPGCRAVFASDPAAYVGVDA